jgi:hypothetical protein
MAALQCKLGRLLLADARHPTELPPFRSSLILGVPRLLLRANGEHKHHIKYCNVSIQRDMTACMAPDHQIS